MGHLLSAAPLDQRRASPRLASHLQTLTAHFRGRPPASDPQRRLFRFHLRKHERRLDALVVAGHRDRLRDRIRVHLAAHAHAACCAARGEYLAFGSWARVCPRSRDPHTNPSAVSAHARHPLFNDYQARPYHLAFHLARRHRGGPDLRRYDVDVTPWVALLTRIRHPARSTSNVVVETREITSIDFREHFAFRIEGRFPNRQRLAAAWRISWLSCGSKRCMGRTEFLT